MPPLNLVLTADGRKSEAGDGRMIAVDVRKSSCLGVVQVEVYPGVLALVVVLPQPSCEQEIVGSAHLLRAEVDRCGCA